MALPCNRCTEEALVVLDQAFDEFEEYPDTEPAAAEACDERGLLEGGDVLLLENGVPVLDVSALVWEEFSLALPVKPLCSSDCGGCVPSVVKTSTKAPAAAPPTRRPRLAALRNLKIS